MDWWLFKENGSRSRIKVAVVGLVFLENLIEYFPLLMDWPNQRQYFTRQDWIIEAFFGVAFPKVERSSTKRRWWMVGLFLDIFKPLILPRVTFLNSNLERTSELRIKRKGERGSPYLRPLLRENKLKGLPLIRMVKEEEEMHNLIQVIQEKWKPNCFITKSKNSHSIL
jgi:hypothetical protein